MKGFVRRRRDLAVDKLRLCANTVSSCELTLCASFTPTVERLFEGIGAVLERVTRAFATVQVTNLFNVQSATRIAH